MVPVSRSQGRLRQRGLMERGQFITGHCLIRAGREYVDVFSTVEYALHKRGCTGSDYFIKPRIGNGLDMSGSFWRFFYTWMGKAQFFSQLQCLESKFDFVSCCYQQPLFTGEYNQSGNQIRICRWEPC